MHANLIDVFSFLSLHYQDQELWNAVDFRRCYYFGGRWVMVRGLIDRPWLLSQEFLRPCFQRDFFYRKMANSPPYQLCSFLFGLLLDVCSHCYSWRVVYSCTNYSRTIHLYDQVPSSVGKIHMPDCTTSNGSYYVGVLQLACCCFRAWRWRRRKGRIGPPSFT